MTSHNALSCLLAAALLALVACGGGFSDPAPSPSASSTRRAVAATPSPVEDEELAEAERLYAEGSFEEGIATFELVAQRGSPAAQSEASWRLARIYYERGENRQALGLLEEYVITGNLSPDRERHALLLLGTLRMATGDLDGGEDAFRDYLDTGGSAAPQVKLRLAALAAGQREYDDAIDLLQEAITEGLPEGAAIAARFDVANYLEEGGDVEAALDEYEVLANEVPETFAGEAIWLFADLAYRDGDAQRSAEMLHELITLYPWHERALEALDRPHLSLSPPSTWERALVLFEARANDAATVAFNEVLTGPESWTVAEAHYYLGILSERVGDYDGALAHYDANIAARGVSSGSALWDWALVLELLGRTEEAIAGFIAVADQGSGHVHVNEALFRAGWLNYTLGRPGTALDLWLRYAHAFGLGHEQAEAHFWAAQAATAIGDTQLATDQLTFAVRADPFDFYGMRAKAELNGIADFPATTSITAAGVDQVAVDSWLTDNFGSEDHALKDQFLGGAWSRGSELLLAGLQADSAAEFDASLGDALGEPWLLYRLATSAERVGLVSLQTRAAWALSRAAADPPAALFLLIYPTPYADLVNAEATANGVSPHLLLALMRQESLYTPDALSPAAASGLMQIIPSTGEDLAEQLGVTPYTNADLLRPKVSIQFGAYFLGAQLEGFSGRPEAALAAYNGGPGNAGRWLDAAGADRDVFIETIDYPETRAYVELVLENYALYLWAYGLTPEPSIPLE